MPHAVVLRQTSLSQGGPGVPLSVGSPSDWARAGAAQNPGFLGHAEVELGPRGCGGGCGDPQAARMWGAFHQGTQHRAVQRLL